MLELTLIKLMKELEMPHQCLLIAFVYVERILTRMTLNKFYFSSAVV